MAEGAGGVFGGVSEKLGKLPPMAIVVVVGGALAIAYYVNRDSGSGTQGTGGVLPPESGTGGMSPGWVSVDPPINNPTTPGYADNEAWGAAAVGWLIGYGIGAVEAGTAVRAYLSAEKLTVRQKNLIDLVSKKAPDGVGPAPNIPSGGGVDDPPPVVTDPPPTTTPPPTTPPPAAGPISGWNGRVFQVKPWPAPGSSLWSIAGIVYGNNKRWPDIYNANRDRISNPNTIRTGQWLRIP